MPAFQGWVEPLNLPATEIDKDSGSPNGILTHTSHTSEVLEERTSINGEKSKSWNYLQTSELVSLWKENLSILKLIRCNKGCHFFQK